MPCNCDYMEPTVKERQRRLAAELLVFTLEKLEETPSKELLSASKDIYGGGQGDLYVMQLCNLLSSLTEEQLNSVAYDPRNKTSRKLADWWEEHQEEDLKRLEKEKQKSVLKDKEYQQYLKLKAKFG